MNALSHWLGSRRRRLYREWERIRQVDGEAKLVVEELRRRRDGMAPRLLEVSALEDAIRETT